MVYCGVGLFRDASKDFGTTLIPPAGSVEILRDREGF
jgi:hypothetical protein